MAPAGGAGNEHSSVVTGLSVVWARLEGMIQATFNSTDGLVHLISLQGGISPTLFANMTELAISKNPHIRNITIAPGVGSGG